MLRPKQPRDAETIIAGQPRIPRLEVARWPVALNLHERKLPIVLENQIERGPCTQTMYAYDPWVGKPGILQPVQKARLWRAPPPDPPSAMVASNGSSKKSQRVRRGRARP